MACAAVFNRPSADPTIFEWTVSESLLFGSDSQAQNQAVFSEEAK